jgi:hypothetical protein
MQKRRNPSNLNFEAPFIIIDSSWYLYGDLPRKKIIETKKGLIIPRLRRHLGAERQASRAFSALPGEPVLRVFLASPFRAMTWLVAML